MDRWKNVRSKAEIKVGREKFMDYFIAAIFGLVIGIFDILIMFFIQKKEEIVIYTKDFYKQKSFWAVILGMPLISVYFMWLSTEPSYLFGSGIILCGYLLILSISDYKYKMLPDMFHIIYGIIFIAYKLCFGTWYDLINGIVGLIVVGIIMGAVYLVKKDQFGMGDLKLLCVCAFLLGMPDIMYLFFRGLVAAAVFSVIRLLRHKADLKTEIPLVPFLLIGAII